MDLQSAVPDSKTDATESQPLIDSTVDSRTGGLTAAIEAPYDVPPNAANEAAGVAAEDGTPILPGAQIVAPLVEMEAPPFVLEALDPADLVSVDAWPEQGVHIWPHPSSHSPLLPPLPHGEAKATLGWVQEWPVNWLRENPVIRRISLGPRRSTQARVPHPDRRQTRPELPTLPAISSLPRTPRVSSQRPTVPSVSRPIDPPAAKGRSCLVLILLIVLTLTGIGAVVTATDALDSAAPFDPLHSFGTFIRDGENQPNATATSVSTLDPPELGSDADAFPALYGPLASGPIADTTSAYHTRIAGRAVDMSVRFGLGVDRHWHVIMVEASDPLLQGWDAATADAVCGVFVPRDGQLRRFVHSDGQTEYIYVSPRLASLFFPASFTDDSGQPTVPGTFSRLDLPVYGATGGIVGCTLALGQHYQ